MEKAIAQTSVKVKFVITDLKYLCNIQERLKFYVKFSIDEIVQQTVVSTRKTAPAPKWTEVFLFNTHGSAILNVQVYARHRLLSDDYAGGAKIRVDNLFLHQGPVELKLDASLGDVDEKFKGDGQGVVQFVVKFDSTAELDALLAATQTNVAEMQPVPWESFLDQTQGFIQIVDAIAELHPYAKIAWCVLSVAYQAMLNQHVQDDSIRNLVEFLTSIFTFLQEGEALMKLKASTSSSQLDLQTGPLEELKHQIETLKQILDQATECGYFIQNYARNRGIWSRFVQNLGHTIDDQVKEYKDKLTLLKEAFQSHATLQIEIATFKVLGQTVNLATQVDFSEMLYSKGATYNPEKGCLPNTRQSVIEEIIDWINGPDNMTPGLFWLSGVAGSGKSAIAHSVAKRLSNQKRLGSFFAFDIAKADRGPEHLFSTISLDLADLDVHWKMSLWDVIKDARSLRSDPSVQRQFDNFLLKPAMALKISGPLLIVIDALDECGDPSSRKPVLATLEQATLRLPPNFRILLTSRAENDIVRVLQNKSHVVCKTMDNIDVQSTNHDISVFFQTRLSEIFDPKESWVNSLVTKSEGLFQWASTACRFIEASSAQTPDEKLDMLLSSDISNLDSLYMGILQKTFPPSKPATEGRIRNILATVIAVQEPLPLSALFELCLDSRPDAVRSVLQPLGSLLSGVAQDGLPVRPLHSSFRDFLIDHTRSKLFYVDLDQHNQNLLMASFKVMKSLHFNICQLKTSHAPNDNQEDLDISIKQNISVALSYACRFWVDHLQASTPNKGIMKELRAFMKTQLLYWLEVLSLVKSMKIAYQALPVIDKWSQDHDEEISILAKDARQFVGIFGSAIAHSAPHIYLSAIPFAPKDCAISLQYQGDFPKTLSLTHGQLADWPAIQNVLEGHTNSVNSVAFAPNDKYIASGSDDKTIHVWDAETGDLIEGLFVGHKDSVNSVAFSPDGKFIASGSDDNTICIWDTKTGDIVTGPIEGHTDGILAVAFSPDSQKVASASADETIQVWNVSTGNLVAGPLRGHKDSVNSIVFSHDGECLVSGSDDATICVWNIETKKCIIGPLKGHTDCVNFVAISPDGDHMVSGSDDHNICVWDTKTGKLVFGPFEAHSDSIACVAFSPNGHWLASCSEDKTICIWNAKNGKKVTEPFKGHTDSVWFIAFSPDGSHIVSGSQDNTIRVWNAATGALVMEPFQGHTEAVLWVEFSPDGKQIVSGSADNTLQLWDAKTGTIIPGIFNGHTDYVSSVAFSPDGKYIVSGADDKTIRVWETETGKLVAGPFTGHTGIINSVAFSPNGKYIASGSDDQTLCLWDAEIGNIISGPFLGHTSWVMSVAFSPDGSLIVSGSNDQGICIWDTMAGSLVTGPIKGHTDCINSVAFSPNGKYIASGADDKKVCVWDAKTSDLIFGPFKGHTENVYSVVFSPDSKYVASGSDDKTILLWDINSGNVVAGPFIGHEGCINSLAFSSNGKQIVSGSDDETVRLWNIETENAVNDYSGGHTEWINTVTFSTDSRYLLSGSSDHTIKMWDVKTGLAVDRPFIGHTHPVNSVAFSPNGQFIASGSEDGLIIIWNANTGTFLNSWKGHEASIYIVVFSPNSEYIASGSVDNTIVVWCIKSSAVFVGPLKGHDGCVNSIVFSPDNSLLASGSDDNTIRVWDVQTGTLAAGPCVKHTDCITSVEFSPNGQYLVSGSDDRTIIIWDAKTGNVIAGPFGKHSNWIMSAIFSLDSTKIFSWTNDNVLWVWDRETQKSISIPAQGHTGEISFAAIACDGKYIAAGSAHGLLWLWNVENLQSLQKPLSITQGIPQFTSQPEMENGWLIGPNSELLFWVPPWNREGLYWLEETLVLGKTHTLLNDKEYVHGTSWHLCKK